MLDPSPSPAQPPPAATPTASGGIGCPVNNSNCPPSLGCQHSASVDGGEAAAPGGDDQGGVAVGPVGQIDDSCPLSQPRNVEGRLGAERRRVDDQIEHPRRELGQRRPGQPEQLARIGGARRPAVDQRHRRTAPAKLGGDRRPGSAVADDRGRATGGVDAGPGERREHGGRGRTLPCVPRADERVRCPPVSRARPSPASPSRAPSPCEE